MVDEDLPKACETDGEVTNSNVVLDVAGLDKQDDKSNNKAALRSQDERSAP